MKKELELEYLFLTSKQRIHLSKERKYKGERINRNSNQTEMNKRKTESKYKTK